MEGIHLLKDLSHSPGKEVLVVVQVRLSLGSEDLVPYVQVVLVVVEALAEEGQDLDHLATHLQP